MFHGQPNNPWRSLHPLLTDEEIATLLQGVDAPTIIAAHSHLSLNRKVGDYHLINPGSVGVPIDGIHGASYALLEGTPGVDHLRSLSVTEEGEVRPGRFLVFSGNHEITMTGLLD